VTDHPSAWKPLIDEWVARERRLHPDAPIRDESVRVRDSVEIDDQAFVLLSFDVNHPWPVEEDAPGDSRSANTAVLQAARVRQPWVERDATRALGELHTPDGQVRVYEHVLGARRAFSGSVAEAALGGGTEVELCFDDEHSARATVVDGWFLAIVPESWRLRRVLVPGAEGYDSELVRDDLGELLASAPERARSAAHAIYFSPLDLRSVMPLVQWQRAGAVVVVASSLEQYDQGGLLRLRIDGVRADDDLFVSWPSVSLRAGDKTLMSAVCGEYGMADTLTVDVGFRPWLSPDVDELVVRVSDLRGAEGPVEPIELRLSMRQTRA
jgi:hypothetical protein